jgi:hypothetical protein
VEWCRAELTDAAGRVSAIHTALVSWNGALLGLKSAQTSGHPISDKSGIPVAIMFVYCISYLLLYNLLY